MKRTIRRGFTLVEILIVVIILGILAAIVIPQFTNASNDARNSSVSSTLQTLRGQIELYKIQHADNPPALTSMWTNMLFASNTSGTTNTSVNATYPLGPYVQAAPVNPANGQSAITNAAASTAGWVYVVTNGQYSVSAVDTTGTGVLTY
jgi:general secretion pathway protein G